MNNNALTFIKKTVKQIPLGITVTPAPKKRLLYNLSII